MSGAIATYTQYDKDGRLVGIGGQLCLPQYLDWMPIEVKAHWFRHIGQGDADTRYVLFHSQGEQRLLIDVTLKPLTYTEYKEKENGAEPEVRRFVEEQGLQRDPRNQ